MRPLVNLRLAAAALVLAASGAEAQSVAGEWEGIANGSRVRITLDSGATGWTGQFHARSFQQDPMPLAAVARHGDSITVTLPREARGAVLAGRARGDQIGGIILGGDDTVGVFRFARSGTPAARMLMAQLERVRPPERITRPDPDSARLITEDIPRFWAVIDSAPADSLEHWLLRDYLLPGTPGLRDFVPGRIMSAADLALRVQRRRAQYDSARSATLRVAEAAPSIRKAYRALKAIYPEAVFPDVYFVIGRFNSGGTASNNGLLIGAEMYRDPARLPAIVAHELIHFQQEPLVVKASLLTQSFREGAGDFVGELIAGEQINNAAHAYGLAHERELWEEFRSRMHETSTTGWLYGNPPGERPADLGYFMGYQIAKAYYDRATDKTAALREIIRGENPNAILERSKYDP